MVRRLNSVLGSYSHRLPILGSLLIHAALLGWLMLVHPTSVRSVPDQPIEIVFEAASEPEPDPMPSVDATPDLLPEPGAPEPTAEPSAEPAPEPNKQSPTLAPPALPPSLVIPSPPRPKPVAVRPPRPASPAASAALVPNGQPVMTAPPVAAPPATPPVATAADPGWRIALGGWLAAHKRYPERARQRGDEGTVGVRFTVNAAGRVLDVAVTSSSGSALLDDAARAMLSGQQVPPFPPSMSLAQLIVPVSIRFRLEQ